MPGGGASGEVVLPIPQLLQHARWLNAVEPPDMTGTPAHSEYTAYWDEMVYALEDTDLVSGGPTTALLALNVAEEMEIAAALNPFEGVASFDPGMAIQKLDRTVDSFTSVIDELDPNAILDAAVRTAVKFTEDELENDDRVQRAIETFERSTEDAFQRRVSDALISHEMGRSVMSTGFDHTLSAMNHDRARQIDDFGAKLALSGYERKVQIVQNYVGQFINLWQLRLQSRQTAVQVVQEAARFEIVARNDQLNADLRLDQSETQWRLDQFPYGSQVLASYAGAGPVTLPKEEGLGSRLIGSAGTAVSAGIGIGTALGNPAAGVIGGLGVLAISALGGLIDARN